LQRHYHWYFDLLPAIDAGNQQQMRIFFYTFDYAIFYFFINMLREIIKDIEDVDGDYNQGILHFVIGKSRTAKIVFDLALFLFYFCCITSIVSLNLIYTTIYLLLL
jgi:4-hydroxybenzoate polyprenyltransferase